MNAFRTALLILIVWECAVVLFQLPEFLLPAPSIIAMRLWQEIQQPIIYQHTAITAVVSVHGLLNGTLCGVVVAWLFYHVTALRTSFAWVLTSSQAIPVIALAPLFLIWIPETYWARVCVATIITFFPIYSATYTALTRIAPELREVAHLHGATAWQTLRHLELYQALPVILSGMRTSMALATTGAVVGEFLGGRDGLGALINIARGLFDTTLVFVAITILVVITLFMHLLLTVFTQYGESVADGTS